MGTYLNSVSGVAVALEMCSPAPISVDFAGQVRPHAAWAVESAGKRSGMQFSKTRSGETQFGKTQLGSRALSPG